MMDKQKEFYLKVLQAKKAEKKEKKAISLYQELVFHRFFEVISNANPIFFSLIKEDELNVYIVKFMQAGAQTDLIWQLPNEFRKFVKKQKKLQKKWPFINDLLWFEWIEISLFMKNYDTQAHAKLNMKNKYRLSKSAKIKKLNYKVYEKEFENKAEYFVLAYYDTQALEVRYREISSFMFEFLQMLKNSTLIQAIESISSKYKLDKKEIKSIMKEPLQELCELGVLQIREK